MVKTYSSTDMATAQKNSPFRERERERERADFYMVIKQSVAVCFFPMYMLTLLTADEILLPGYMNWFTNFRGLAFNEEMAPSRLKDMNSVLSEFA